MSLIVLHLEGPLSGQSQHFDDSFEEILFGRSPNADVVYPPECETIEESHLKLLRTKFGHYSLEFVGDRYVEIDGTLTRTGVMLRSGRTLRVGDPNGPSFQVEIVHEVQGSLWPSSPSGLARPQRGGMAPSSPVDVVSRGRFGSAELARAPEPTMDEILASIRRIIADDESSVSRDTSSSLQGSDVIFRKVGTDDQIINDIADVLSRGAANTGAPEAPIDATTGDEGDFLDLTVELGRLEPVKEPLVAQLQALRLAAGPIVVRAKRGDRKQGRDKGLAKNGDLPSPTPPPPRPPADTVDFSVFGPKELQSGNKGLIQVFLHTLDQRDISQLLALESDPDASRRGTRTLAAEVVRGQSVQVLLECDELDVDASIKTLIWRGVPCACEFTVKPPQEKSDRILYLRVLVLIDSVPIGSLTFALKVTAEAVVNGGKDLKGDRARHYNYAFLSYATADRAEVIKRAQMLRAGGTNFFLDLLSVKPREEWETRLFAEIDRCDVFYLFWSSHAKKSEWVMRETDYALARRALSASGDPDIIPVIIEGPPPPTPPEALKDIHFNDWMLYVLSGVEAARSAQPPN